MTSQNVKDIMSVGVFMLDKDYVNENTEEAFEYVNQMLEAINDLRLTEIYVNLKNHDFESCGNYKIDEKEAEKFIEVYKLLRGIDEDDAE